jgi:hypothetical protein
MMPFFIIELTAWVFRPFAIGLFLMTSLWKTIWTVNTQSGSGG